MYIVERDAREWRLLGCVLYFALLFPMYLERILCVGKNARRTTHTNTTKTSHCHVARWNIFTYSRTSRTVENGTRWHDKCRCVRAIHVFVIEKKRKMSLSSTQNRLVLRLLSFERHV